MASSSSPTKSIALAIAPKFPSLLSICGSFIILSKVIRSKKRRQHTMQRIMVGLSISDILSSMFFFASTWPIPEGTLSWFGDGTTQVIYGAIGTETTCNVAGFFNQFQVANPLFNATLATYYVLSVCYGWSDARIKHIEWIFFVIPFGYALLTSIFAVATNLIGHVEWTCWILPPELSIEGAEVTPIQSRFRMIQWLFLFGPVWVCIIYISIMFGMLYKKMKTQEQKMKRYSTPFIKHKQRRYSYNSGNSAGSLPHIEDGSRQNKMVIVSSVPPDLSKRDLMNKRDIHIHDEEKGPSGGGDNRGGVFSQQQQQHELLKSNTDDNHQTIKNDNKNNEENHQPSEHCSSPSGSEPSPQDLLTNVEAGGSVKEENNMVQPHHKRKRSSILSRISSCTTLRNHDNDDDDEEEEEEQFGNTNGRRASFISRTSMESAIESVKSSVAGRLSKRRGSGGSELRLRIFNEDKKSHQIAIRGMLYVIVFYITWFFPTLSRITDLVGVHYFAIQFLDTFLLPLQGFLNCLIYLRPSYMRFRRKHPECGILQSLWLVIVLVEI